MARRKRTGVRRIDDVEGGAIAWLHPGGADLDDVLLALAAYMDDLWRQRWPDDEEVPTTVPTAWREEEEVEVGYYRRLPWCHCGEGHGWHCMKVERPGPGVSLAVVAVTW